MSTQSNAKFFTPSEFVAEFNIETLRTAVNEKTGKMVVILNEDSEKEFLPVSKQIQEDHELVVNNPNLKFYVPVEIDRKGREVLDYQSSCLIVVTPGDMSKFVTKGLSIGF